MNLGGFIDTFKDAIAKRVVESYPPLYRPSENGGTLPRLLRKPLGAQADAIRGAALSLKAHRGTTVVGEMGTGKTFIGAAAAHMAGFERVLIICPPHLVPKWKREVEMTVPGVRAAIVESITDLERLRLSVGSGPLFAVMSREKAKLSYRWMPAVIQRWAVSKGRLLREEETGEPFRVPCCPDCTAQVVDKDGVPLTFADLNRRKHTCAACDTPLWQADRSGPARYPLADYIKHHMRGFFDLLIGDEVHEFKGRGSAQGIAAGILADVCGKSLSLTGTLLGGYSSTIFHLLYRFSPEIRTEFGRSDEGRWIKRYGFEEVTVGKPDDDAVEDGRNSRRRSYRKVTRERPGLVPSALFHIIGNTVFLRLADVASGLPDYEEKILVSSMDSEEDATGYSQRSAYNTVFEELKKELAAALKSGSKRLLATYLQTLLAYPDGCTKGETVFDPRTGDIIVQVPPLSEDKLYPKEKALIDLVAAERLEGRRVLVYVTHTGTRDITGRMDDFLTRNGFRVAVMKADAVAPNRREKWVADKVKEGIDVLICHPRLVQTGLDLIDFPTIVWDETEFSVFQSTQQSTVLVGGRFGCNWGSIGATGCESYGAPPALMDRRTGLPNVLRVQAFSGRPDQNGAVLGCDRPTNAYGRYHHLRNVARQPIDAPRPLNSCSVTRRGSSVPVLENRGQETRTRCPLSLSPGTSSRCDTEPDISARWTVLGWARRAVSM